MYQVLWALGWMAIGLLAGVIIFLPILVSLIYRFFSNQWGTHYITAESERVERIQWHIIGWGYFFMIFISLVAAAPR